MRIKKIDNETMRLEGTPKELAWILAVAASGHTFAKLFMMFAGTVPLTDIRDLQREFREQV